MKLTYFGIAAIVLLASGCRDTSTPSKALVGHWLLRSQGEEIHRCYGSTGQVTYYNKAEDILQKRTYSIVSESPKGRLIRVQMGGTSLVEKVELSADGNSAKATLEPLSQPDTTWKYLGPNIDSCN